jgi:hypothetical protein
VWKKLWKMCKTFENTRKIMGDNSLWENLRKNISGENGGRKGLLAVRRRNGEEHLQDLPRL